MRTGCRARAGRRFLRRVCAVPVEVAEAREDALALLARLAAVEMTVDLLQRTKIGLALSQMAKLHTMPTEVRDRAESIVAAWKRTVVRDITEGKREHDAAAARKLPRTGD